MGNVVTDFGINSPVKLENDPVEGTWSAVKTGFHLGRQIPPALLPMLPKIAAAATATNDLFLLGAANVLTLYVNFWMAIGGAYAAAREEAKVDGLLMGYSTGFGHRLAGTYSYDEFEWRHDTTNRATKFRKELAEIQK